MHVCFIALAVLAVRSRGSFICDFQWGNWFIASTNVAALDNPETLTSLCGSFTSAPGGVTGRPLTDLTLSDPNSVYQITSLCGTPSATVFITRSEDSCYYLYETTTFTGLSCSGIPVSAVLCTFPTTVTVGSTTLTLESTVVLSVTITSLAGTVTSTQVQTSSSTVSVTVTSTNFSFSLTRTTTSGTTVATSTSGTTSTVSTSTTLSSTETSTRFTSLETTITNVQPTTTVSSVTQLDNPTTSTTLTISYCSVF